MPTDPDSREIIECAVDTIARDAAEPHASFQLGVDVHDAYLGLEKELKLRALKHALSILAQIPDVEAEETPTDLVALIHDRDESVFGLLFQSGLTFTVRLRHGNRDKLRLVTERVVNVLAPRADTEIDDIVRQLPEAERIERRFRPQFDPIQMKTPAGELAQTGEVHAVTSQLGLLRRLALEGPQVYLVFLTAVLMIGDLALGAHLIGDLVFRELSMRTWLAGNLARLATAAFGAYLVTLFLRFAELRVRLGGVRTHSHGRRPLHGRRHAYGAFVYWRTD